MEDLGKKLSELSKKFKEVYKPAWAIDWAIDYEREYKPMVSKTVKGITYDTDDFEGVDIESLVAEYEKDNNESVEVIENPQDEFVAINNQHIDVNNFWIGDYLVDPDKVSVFQLVEKVLQTGNYLNILALGEAGTGKTTFATKIAEFFSIENELVDVPTKTEPLMWFGQREIQNGNTVWGKTPLTDKLANGNMITIFDEINRTRADNLNTLLGLLDFRKQVNLMDMKITVGKGTVFYATANIGYEYGATVRFDKAMYDRFTVYLNFQHLVKEREIEVLTKRGISKQNAEFTVELMNVLRNAIKNNSENLSEFTFPFSLSPRRSLAVAQHLEMGLSQKQAIQLAITNGSNQDDLNNIQSICNKVMSKSFK